MTGFELFVSLLLVVITMCSFVCALVIVKIANHLTLRSDW